MDWDSDEWEEGFQAYRDGIYLSENPYSSLSQQYKYDDWCDGWIAAEHLASRGRL